MADFIAFHTYYSRHNFLSPSTMLPRPTSHKRSNSSENNSLAPDKTVTKARSTNDLSGTVTAKPTPGVRSSSVGNFQETSFSTLKDPRLASHSEDSETSESTQSHHPDLSNEVAALSVKLVQAINNQTTLDDNLVATRQELEQAQAKIRALELENEKYRQDIDQEVLIKKSDVDYEMLRLQAALAEEKAQRALVEKEKKGIEQELETLTAALFEEANKMVAAAKLEREAVEKKNEQLRSQVKDTEALLASHQEQLAELKSVLHGLNLAKDDSETRTIISTAPSSPTMPRHPLHVSKNSEIPDIPEEIPTLEELTPGPSTSFPHLIKPVCRTDIQAYEDFRELFTTSRASKPASRATSGSYAGLNVMSLASGFGSASSSPAKSQTHSPNGSVSSPQPVTSHIPLKETRFYKRVLSEDIEPTLRLDAAPGISWLTRRSVLSGICDGTLLVEPMPPSAKKYEFPCSMCGERRNGPTNERTHRFRTSDSETAQRYPLCVLCLERVRSSCEFTGYLRLILDGHVRIGDAEEEKDAWDETIRLRERMFWSRIGGGIIPLFAHANGFQGNIPTPTEGVEAPVADGRDECQRSIISTVPEDVAIETKNLDDIEEHNHDEGSVGDDPFVSAPSESESTASSAAVSPTDANAPVLKTDLVDDMNEQPDMQVIVPENTHDEADSVKLSTEVEETPSNHDTTKNGDN
ncbi:rab guanine nucleotide exchange factor S2 [Aspergillus tubingensis]|uniref:GDP/GTP exchange factor Sec2p n=2 Tax=Aspergillus subgen. Circumdati TaxID=2720871 RepID=A0A100IP01_ASPNG|nr:GDP/GTP exchange factor Sec2p [Aspergillus tubingensis]GAQ44694.1 GDP/GTP exchange factor Sec2p [Aspergillus niger]GFN17370.1 GDP/GTP exchange factor Sec2p [Aspergillus tubingensis]GLA64181.1 rab guanine nucleotide exchange factor S2 [Aspergillus tubingensis]GLA76738.1 rab guanine nucleotide exchange factor S2 [Aspergillus tubingensis]GLA80993.1 rab guanine nucleotide exchange factor S2 [Aspergillus tubingensis]